MRYSIKLSYSGAPFCGWQRQASAPSVQETLETALGTLLGHPVPVVGAGRTDTGVNAVGYIASFDAEGPLDGHFLCYKLNAILPSSITVHSIRQEGPEFHARFDAGRREYTYFLHRCKDPFMQDRSFYCGYPELDFDIMNKAASMLVGTHCFSCFEKVGSDNKTSDCTVFEAYWKAYEPTHAALMGYGKEESVGTAPYWYFRISADRFLRNMVRAIVGTLLEVGRGKRSLEDFASLILPPTGSSSGSKTVPPSGSSFGSQTVPPSGFQTVSTSVFPSVSPSSTPNVSPNVSPTVPPFVSPSISHSTASSVSPASPDRNQVPPRCRAGESVPGYALFLSQIKY